MGKLKKTIYMRNFLNKESAFLIGSMYERMGYDVLYSYD